MLPWLFVVLVLLNAGLFLWGYQREKSMEPPPMPLPEGQYEIRLIGETPEDSRQSPDAGAPEAAFAKEPAAGEEAGEAGVVGSIAVEESGPLTGAAVGTTGVAADVAPSSDEEKSASEPDQADVVQTGDTEPAPEDVTGAQVVGSSAQGERAMSDEATSDEATPDDVIEETNPVDSMVPAPDGDEPVGEEAHESETDGDAGSVEVPAEPLAHRPDGLRTDELEADEPEPVSGTADFFISRTQRVPRGKMLRYARMLRI